MKKYILAILFFGILITSINALEIGDTAPTFANPDLNGSFILSKNVIGKGWVILDFFATDCEGCKKEMPELEVLLEDFKDNGLEILVFATDSDGLSIVKPYFIENPTNTKVVLDRYRIITQKYEVSEIPAVFLINPEGKIAFIAVAYSEETVGQIRTILNNSLDDT